MPPNNLLHLPQPFTTAEARDAGLSETVLGGLRRRGVVLRLARGLYAERELWESWWPSEQATAAAAAAARVVAGAVASHSSAALLRDLPSARLPVFPVHVTVPDLRTTPDSAWYRVHHGWLPPDQVDVVEGIALTTSTRTVVDTIRQVRVVDGLAIADAAVARGDTSLEDLLALRRAQTRWRNVTRVDEVLRLVDPRRESWLESASARAFDLDGVPPPIPQVEILSAAGEFIARVDDYWLAGIAGEADGHGKSTLDDDGRLLSPDAMDRRRRESDRRAARIRAQGIELFRWDTDEVERPGLIAGRYHDAATRAAGSARRPLVRCACCRRGLSECEVTQRLTAFRARLAR